MAGLRRDVRQAIRGLVGSPVFTAVVVLSLALGMGAAATIFTLADKLLLAPLPVVEPQRLVSIFSQKEEGGPFLQTSYPNYRDLRERNTVFSDLAACQWIGLSLTGGDRPEQIIGQLVTGNFFTVLGVPPARGRGFLPEEDATPGTHPVVVLSHRLWQRRFGGDLELVGRTVEINRRPFTVVGIAPEGFKGRGRVDPTDAWVPLMMHETVFSYSAQVAERGWGLFALVGRLAPGVALADARAAMDTLAAELAREYPDVNEGRELVVLPLAESAMDPALEERLRGAAGQFAGASAVLLVIAWINAANLFLVRGRRRAGETALRLSLGAGWRQLVRPTLVESLLLALAAGALALPLAALGRNLLLRVRPPYLPEGSVDFGLDLRVVLFAAAAALVTGLICGLLPALRSARVPPATVLQEGALAGGGMGGGRFALGRLLVVAQVALSLMALIGAGLFLRSFWSARQVDPGFDARRLLAVSFRPGALGLDEAGGLELARRMAGEARSVAGVEAAAVSGKLLFNPVEIRRYVAPEERQPRPGEEAELVAMTQVGPGYFQALGLPLVRGRGFTLEDDADAPRVAVVSETLARRFWPGEEAVGRRLSLSGSEEPVQVVGVARDVRYGSLLAEVEPFFYLPLAQDYTGSLVLYARTRAGPSALAGPVRSAVQAAAPGLPLLRVETGEELVAGSLWAPRLGFFIMSFFGGVALVLAALGTYGITADWVSRRRRDIGLRLALGAGRGAVLSLVLGQALATVVAGLALGVLAALAGTRLLASQLHGVSPADPLTFTAMAAFLGLVALAAGYLPAHRATAVAPTTTLRGEGS